VNIPTPTELELALAGRGYRIHREPARLNIVVLRKTPGTVDAFDDMLCVLVDGRVWACRCTADPGKPSREHPKRRDGTAAVRVGQLVDGYKWGRHHDEYECLVPAVPVPVLRYTSLDDEVGDPSTSWTTQIHHASATRESTVVGAWSEGCIVVASPTDWAELMRLCHAQDLAHPGLFTVSVLDWA